MAPQSVAGAQTDPGLAYLDLLRESLDTAAEAVGGFVEQDLDLAGTRLRLRCAGEPVRDVLLPPYEHLAAPGPGAPELTVGVFDTATTGVTPPPVPWAPLEAASGTNPTARFESDRACVLAAAGTGVLVAAASVDGEAILCLPDATAVPPSERAAPLREPLHLLMGARQLWMTHAGAAGRNGVGVLLAGHSGSGKSTLALSCALAGMEVAADDYVVLEMGTPPLVHALQSTAKLTADSAARLGLGAGAIDAAGFEPTLEGPAKALVEIEALAPGTMRRCLTAGAVIAPRVSDLPRPALEAIPPARGLQALAPSSVMQARSQVPGLLAALGKLVREVPSYSLWLGPEPEANAAAVAEVVDGLA